MSEETELGPTPAVLEVARLLAETSTRFLGARFTAPGWGKYESETEALNLMYLIIRHVDGIVTLAQRDLVMLPAAMTLARTIYEISVRGLWMLDPSDPFEREVRWLAHLQEEEDFYERFETALREAGKDATSFAESRKAIRSFRLEITSCLPTKYKPLKKLPNFRETLRAIGRETEYTHYSMLSQYTHGTYHATWLYRRNLGTMAEFGEFVIPKDWHPCLHTCWIGLVSLGRRVLECLSGNPNAFVSSDFINDVEVALGRVKSEVF